MSININSQQKKKKSSKQTTAKSFAKILKPVDMDLVKETNKHPRKHIILKYQERLYDLIFRIHLASSAQYKKGLFVPLNAQRMQKLYGMMKVIEAETDTGKIIYLPKDKLKIIE
jgi:hypothetical protein